MLIDQYAEILQHSLVHSRLECRTALIASETLPNIKSKYLQMILKVATKSVRLEAQRSFVNC